MSESLLRVPAVGTRIRLVAMGEDPDPILPGTEGTVTHLNPWGSPPHDEVQIAVDWDNGRSLMLLASVDRWVEIPT